MKLLSIHLDGAFLTTRACLRHMYKANYGRVVYMGSVHSRALGISEADVVSKVMLNDTVDGQSLVVSHGWYMH